MNDDVEAQELRKPAGLPNGDSIKGYEIIEPIGEGGFAIVYRARQIHPKREVALKLMKPGLETKELLGRFDSEQQALALMDHPNIAKVFGSGLTDHARAYIAMEYIVGEDIETYCDKHKLSIKDRLKLFELVCRAVQHAHQKGVIHRDIKPSNIIVTTGKPGIDRNSNNSMVSVNVDTRDQISPMLIDFGIIKSLHGRLTDQSYNTSRHQFIGTPAYMSPEQAEKGGVDVDTRADIYSLGVLLYQLITGTLPFTKDVLDVGKEGVDKVKEVITKREPMLPSTKFASMAPDEATTQAQARGTDMRRLKSLISGDLDWIVMKCLEKDRAQRYGTVHELAADVNRHLSNKQVHARPPSLSNQIYKAWLRNRFVFSAAAVLFLSILVGFGVAIVGWHETGVARDYARLQYEKAETARKQLAYKTYVANIQRAADFLDGGDTARAREKLDECGPEDKTNWEWRYLDAASDQSLLTMQGHTDEVLAAAFSPMGGKIVTGSMDGTIRLWDTASGRENKRSTFNSPVKAVAFSPNGKLVVAAAENGTVRLVDVETWQMHPTRFSAGPLPVRSVAFSPDGSKIITAGENKLAQIWDTSSGKLVGSLGNHHKGPLFSAFFSSSGTNVVTASDDWRATVWSIKYKPYFSEAMEWDTENTIWEPMTVVTHKEWASWATFNPDGTQIVTAGHDNTAKIWDAKSGKELATFTHPVRVASADVNPRNRDITTSAFDQSLRIWNSAEQSHPSATLHGHLKELRRAAYNADGTRIITASADKTARLWDSDTKWINPALTGHQWQVLSADFSPESKRIVTGSMDGTAKIWDAITGLEMHSLYLGNRNNMSIRVQTAQFSRDGKWVVTAADDGTTRVWNSESGEEEVRLVDEAPINSAAFYPDGARIVLACSNGMVRIWDWVSRKNVRVIELPSPVQHVSVSPDGAYLIMGTRDNGAQMWDANQYVRITNRLATSQVGKRIPSGILPSDGSTECIMCAKFSPTGRDVVTVASNGITRIINIAAQKGMVLGMGEGEEVLHASFSPDGRRVVTGSRDGRVRLWDAETGAALIGIGSHRLAVYCVAFSPDGESVVSTGMDHVGRVWNSRPYRERYRTVHAVTATADSLLLQITEQLANGISLKESFQTIRRLAKTNVSLIGPSMIAMRHAESQESKRIYVEIDKLSKRIESQSRQKDWVNLAKILRNEGKIIDDQPMYWLMLSIVEAKVGGSKLKDDVIRRTQMFGEVSKRFNDVHEPDDAETLVMALAVASNTQDGFGMNADDLAGRLASVAINDVEHRNHPHRQIMQALVLYRKKRWDESASECQAVVVGTGSTPVELAQASAIEAMVFAQKRLPDKALKCIERAKNELKQDTNDGWPSRMIAELLVEEAAGVLGTNGTLQSGPGP